MDTDPEFRIGSSATAHVIVRIVGREHPQAMDYWDGNWLKATVTIAAGGFVGELAGSLRAEEFARLRTHVGAQRDNLAGTARYETMEDWLTIDIVGDGLGHFHAACLTVDVPTANQLTFGIDFDQTELGEILRGLDAVCEAWPVRAKP